MSVGQPIETARVFLAYSRFRRDPVFAGAISHVLDWLPAPLQPGCVVRNHVSQFTGGFLRHDASRRKFYASS